MVTEDEVVEAAPGALRTAGWTITQQLTTKQTGVDVIAERHGRRLLVEAKGYTSASITSARYGKPFSPNQLWDHTAKAIYKALAVVSAGEDLAAIALPDDPKTVAIVADVQATLDALGVHVIWVEHRNGDSVSIPEPLR
jgi:hypothetical protein